MFEELPVYKMLTSIVTLTLVGASYAQDTVLGVYMFHRHGDRTPKALAPANLTDLGYAQVYSSGNYYRNRYIAADASANIKGINSDVVKQTQISVSAPQDVVLMNSAQGFLQALYPAVGSADATQPLRNGTKATAPMNGYQLIPVATVATGGGVNLYSSHPLKSAINGTPEREQRLASRCIRLR